MRRGTGAVGAALAMILVAGVAVAQEADERFAAATALMIEERYREAADALLALAAAEPTAAVADDALFTAGQLLEERLSDPAAALAVYRRLVERYPDSRAALAAARRADLLVESLGPDRSGAEATARFTEIQQAFPDRPEAESIVLMEHLVAEHPRWSGIPAALLWLGEVHARARRWERAAAHYREVAERWPESEHAFAALRGAGDVALAQRRFDEAARRYRAMPIEGDPARARALADALAILERARAYHQAYRAAWLGFGLAVVALGASAWLAAGGARRLVRGLARPPIEVVFMAPVAGLLVAAAYSDHAAVGPAVAWICAGGLGLAWVSGVGLRLGRRPLGPGRVAVHAAACAVGVLAVAYVALYRFELVELVVNTARFGPEG